jgi:hypothetical protein
LSCSETLRTGKADGGFVFERKSAIEYRGGQEERDYLIERLTWDVRMDKVMIMTTLHKETMHSFLMLRSNFNSEKAGISDSVLRPGK